VRCRDAPATLVASLSDASRVDRLAEAVALDAVWLVTGASGGVGRALTESALRLGRRVVATANRLDDLRPILEDHGDSVIPIELDVSDESADREVVEQVVAAFGHIDVVINNAGYEGRLGSGTEDVSERIQTNLFGALWVSEFALPYMRDAGSGLIALAFPFVGDETGIAPRFLDQTQQVLEGLRRQLAREVATDGIKVTICVPSDRYAKWSD
jgi:NAD(P)-dependent dehydrogenase (short-subunit alcohol dehydrogenase family)